MPLARFFPRVVARTRAWPRPGRYAGAGGLIGGLFLLRYSVMDGLLPAGYPFLLLFLGVLLSGSLFRRGPAVFASLFSAALVAVFILPPSASLPGFDPRQVTALGLFLAVSALMVETIGGQQEAVDRLAAANHHRLLILREYRHRARNDLASLVGLLRLRARVAPNDAARTALIEAAGHALALSRVHTRLVTASPGDGVEPVVDTGPFIGGLVADLDAARSGDGIRAVAVICDAECHILGTERAVPLGLLLQEMVSNALTHGFPGEDCRGSVWVRFTRQEAEYCLTVADDGEPQPAGSDSRGEDGLNLRMLRAMAAQLRGSFTRRVGAAGRGVVADLRFPVEAPTMLPMPSGPLRA